MSEAVATSTTVEHGDASELPEVTWFWRRVFVFSLTGFMCAVVAWVAWHSSDPKTLRDIAMWSQALIFLLVFVYVAGATATDVVRLVAALRSTRRETTTTAAAGATS